MEKQNGKDLFFFCLSRVPFQYHFYLLIERYFCLGICGFFLVFLEKSFLFGISLKCILISFLIEEFPFSVSILNHHFVLCFCFMLKNFSIVILLKSLLHYSSYNTDVFNILTIPFLRLVSKIHNSRAGFAQRSKCPFTILKFLGSFEALGPNCSFVLTQSLGDGSHATSSWVPAIDVGDLDCVPGPQLWP